MRGRVLGRALCSTLAISARRLHFCGQLEPDALAAVHVVHAPALRQGRDDLHPPTPPSPLIHLVDDRVHGRAVCRRHPQPAVGLGQLQHQTGVALGVVDDIGHDLVYE